MIFIVVLVFLVPSCSSSPQMQIRRVNSQLHQDREITDTNTFLLQDESSFPGRGISNTFSDTDFSNTFRTVRRKRVESTIGKLERAGIQFIDSVLRGAKQISPAASKRKKYEKPGGIDQLKWDFNKIYNPASVSRFTLPNGGYGKIGRAGDRVVIMKTKAENGKPSLEIFKATDIRNPMSIRRNRRKLSCKSTPQFRGPTYSREANMDYEVAKHCFP